MMFSCFNNAVLMGGVGGGTIIIRREKRLWREINDHRHEHPDLYQLHKVVAKKSKSNHWNHENIDVF